ncbi:type 2 isopentenyl-diphosphate Delta-isomerase [Carnobacteriaceae bacterium zg-C25]|nr:type 2 isopentenyl-diphosphate Delta-isomerase [Carnobacteriaceae bacterium zg-C25]
MTNVLHSTRKDDHVTHALSQYNTHSTSDLEQTRFVHHALSDISVDDISLSTELDTLQLSLPFFINAMTGGSEQTHHINEQLAIVANETGMAMATGSISVALNHPETAQSFKVVRQHNPNGIIFANLGAHHNLENAKRAVDLLQADALQLHLNTPQEIVMPEGDRTFSGWLQNIENITSHLNVPVIVKEVGFGMSQQTVQQLENVGVRIIDVAGRGGTNFVSIEDARRQDYSLSMLTNWGQTTLESLLEATNVRQNAHLIASGGIKNVMDIAKCLSLGANAVGLSGHFLHMVTHYGVDETIKHVHDMQEQLKAVMTILGRSNIAALQHHPIVLASSAKEWCQARGIDYLQFSRR